MSVYDDIQTAAVFAILISGIEKQEKARGRDARSAPSRSACGQRVPMVTWSYFSRSPRNSPSGTGSPSRSRQSKNVAPASMQIAISG